MFCTAEEVRESIDFPATGAPIGDSEIERFILDSEDEIEQIYNTRFGNVEASGTATSGTTTTLTDSSKSFTVDTYIGYVVWIYGGTGEGQYREIQANSSTTLTVSPAFTTVPDTTSNYRIVKLGYKDEDVDGSGTTFQFTNFQPLINLNSLTIDDTDVTVSKVFVYNAMSKIELDRANAEVTIFTKDNPQNVNMKYIFGVYPIPRIIKRLCIILAAMRTLTAQIAGTYDDFTSISLPGGFSGSKGEPYMNIQSALNYMQGEARGIIYGSQSTGQVSGDFRTIPSYRPFTLFG